MNTVKRLVTIKPNLEMTAWKYMRLSAILLVPLVWIHVILNTLVIGAENINLDYVAIRWAQVGWRIYDILLLVFAFSHGVNGLRQVLFDFTSNSTMQKILSLFLFIFWLTLSALGTVSILGGVGQ
jgi:succinate dehydrogenase / fumarate reductase membrane anchor subunit